MLCFAYYNTSISAMYFDAKYIELNRAIEKWKEKKYL